MKHLFEITYKHRSVNEDGKERKKTSLYILSAVDFTDAEANAGVLGTSVFSGEFEVKNIKKSKITQVFESEGKHPLYKAKISFVTIDEELGREKKTSEYMLFESESFDKLSHMIESSLQYMLIPFTVSGAAITNFDGFYDPEFDGLQETDDVPEGCQLEEDEPTAQPEYID
jgi:hypothetical protein